MKLLLHMSAVLPLATSIALGVAISGARAWSRWSTFSSERFGFAVDYPSNWRVNLDDSFETDRFVPGRPELEQGYSSGALGPQIFEALWDPADGAYLQLRVYPSAVAVSPAPTGTLEDHLTSLAAASIPFRQLPSRDLNGVPNLVLIVDSVLPNGQLVEELQFFARMGDRMSQRSDRACMLER